jgi:hypothetical protein
MRTQGPFTAIFDHSPNAARHQTASNEPYEKLNNPDDAVTENRNQWSQCCHKLLKIKCEDL